MKIISPPFCNNEVEIGTMIIKSAFTNRKKQKSQNNQGSVAGIKS